MTGHPSVIHRAGNVNAAPEHPAVPVPVSDEPLELDEINRAVARGLRTQQRVVEGSVKGDVRQAATAVGIYVDKALKLRDVASNRAVSRHVEQHREAALFRLAERITAFAAAYPSSPAAANSIAAIETSDGRRRDGTRGKRSPAKGTSGTRESMTCKVQAAAETTQQAGELALEAVQVPVNTGDRG